jgi:hypothetical protein
MCSISKPQKFFDFPSCCFSLPLVRDSMSSTVLTTSSLYQHSSFLEHAPSKRISPANDRYHKVLPGTLAVDSRQLPRSCDLCREQGIAVLAIRSTFQSLVRCSEPFVQQRNNAENLGARLQLQGSLNRDADKKHLRISKILRMDRSNSCDCSRSIEPSSSRLG